jgi:conjugal transfer pilus assembly protein TraK
MKIKYLLSAMLVTLSVSGMAAEDYSANFAPLNSGFAPPPEAKGAPGRNVMPVDRLPAVQDQMAKPPKPPLPKPKKVAPPKPKKVKKPNPYDIPDSAMTLIPEMKNGIRLPKLGVSQPTSPKVFGQNVITVGSGRNEVIYASFRQPNRISTPFLKPKIIDMSGTEFQVVGQDVYFVPDKEEPIGIFISGDDAPGRVASLTLVPANIPGQNISLMFENKREMGDAQTGVGPESSHIEYVRSILASAINGDVPEGFDVSETNVGMARIGNVMVKPTSLLSSRDKNVFIYKLKNVGPNRHELTEQSFYEEGVSGIAFWPKVNLEPGDESSVYILAPKQE